MRLAIFGATGRTGRHLVRRALAAGHSLRCLVRAPEGAAFPAGVELVKGSARDPAPVGKTVCGTDAVLSCLGGSLDANFFGRGRIAAPGTAYRMDEIPLPLKPALKSPYPTDEEVVRRINQAIAQKPFWLPDGSQPQMLSAQV